MKISARSLLVLCPLLFSGEAFAIGFDSPTRVLLDTVIEDGAHITAAEDEATVKEEIGQQLHFIEGQLEREKATPQLFHRMHITLGSRTPRDDGRFRQSYRADFEVAWDKAKLPPGEFTLVLPEGGDDDTLALFEKKYRPACANNLGAPFVVPFWYQFDPMKCPLGSDPSPELAMRAKMKMTKHAGNTSGKYPEYQKIWEDGKLVVAYIAGNYDSVDTLHGGAAALERLLTPLYGKALTSQKKTGKGYALYEAEYQTPSGKLVTHGVDVLDGNIQNVDESFIEQFRGFLEEADLVAYNGHAGLGENIQAFTRFAQFTPKRYYLYWFNACKPFAYIDQPLFDAMEAANPGVPVSKYLDVMSMAGVGYFSSARDVASIVQSLVGKKDTFRQLLAKLGTSEAPVVYNEEDNAWPAPFVE